MSQVLEWCIFAFHCLPPSNWRHHSLSSDIAAVSFPFADWYSLLFVMYRLRAVLCNLLQVCFEIEFRVLWVRYH